MLGGEIKGLFCFGQNPAVGGANARLIRAALDKLEWIVVADLFEHETAMFWKRPGVDPKRIPTEVIVLPAASGREGREHRQQRAVDAVALPRGEAHRRRRPDLEIVDGLARALKRAYEKDGALPEPIREVAWEYAHAPGSHEADPHASRGRSTDGSGGR